MPWDSETAAWTAFAASVFVLMAVTLVCDAEHYADSAGAFSGETGGRAALVRAYRLAGGFFCVAAAGVVWAARLKPIHLDRPMRLAFAAILGAVGFGLAARKLGPAPRLPAALEADGTLPASTVTLRRKAAEAARWLLIADFAAFACFLLTS